MGDVVERIRRNTKSIGDQSEVMVLAALVETGHKVAIPFGEDNRYEFIVDKSGTLSRVQVKTGRLRKGSILFNSFSSHSHRGRAVTRGYAGEVEFFGVFWPDLGTVYLVPVDEVRATGGILAWRTQRMPKSGRSDRCRHSRYAESGLKTVGTAVNFGVR